MLAAATFAACNFAAFLTRSGVFSSLHAFSQSPVGWMFLLLIADWRRPRRPCCCGAARPHGPRTLAGLSAKEGVAAASVLVLMLLAAAVFLGTASLPLSQVFFPHKVLLGAGFYNSVLIPTGLLLLAAMAAAPLLRSGAPPEGRQMAALLAAAGVGAATAGLAWLGGFRQPLAWPSCPGGDHGGGTHRSWILDTRNHRRQPPGLAGCKPSAAGAARTRAT